MMPAASSNTPGGALVPYAGDQTAEPFFLGPLEEATARLNAVLAQGTYARPPQMHAMPDGKVLLITEVHPNPSPGQAGAPLPGTSRLSQWPVYYKAALMVPAVAVLGVMVYLFAISLMAVVAWGIANALAIGGFLLCGFVAVLVFLGALTRARHGHPMSRGGGYR